jgi:oligopeptidase B
VNLPPPPVAERRPRTTSIHGRTLEDPYFWLRDRADPSVLAYLQEEDRWADLVMAPTEELRKAIYDDILAHIKQTDETAPVRDGAYFYYARTVEGRQYPIFCRKHGTLDAPEEVILDQNELAVGHAFLGLGAMAVSDDGRLLAYTVDTTGYRQFTLQIKDLQTGALLAERIERVDHVVWATDNRTIFYTTEDPVTKRTDRLYAHVVGAPSSDLRYAEPDELFDLALYRSRDRRMIFLQSASKTSGETRFLPADAPEAALTIVLPREPEHEYDVEHRGGEFYIRTNREAINFKVVTAPMMTPGPEHWRTLVPPRADVKVAGVDVFARHVVVSEWESGLEHVAIVDPATGAARRLTYPEPVYAVSVAQNREFDTDVVRYLYQSLVTPPSVFDHDMATGQTTLVKETDVPGGFDRSQYVSSRVFATARDATRVPISVVHRRDVPLDGSAPLLLYGYGSYGITIAPMFAASRLPLLDRGMVYAIAHVRGGGELGEPWRRAGRMMTKMNTFTDFIACAEHLVAARFTSADRLVAQGGSAGGLLVTAAANMRPDLFRAVIAQVPFVDILNTMLDASLPLTTSEYIEWGNPAERAAFDYMVQYSPYDNLRPQAYPAMLVKVSLHDSQVPYWEGAKLVAKLRTRQTGDRPILLKVNFGAGHGGASGRYDALRETAFNWAFVLWQTK